MVEVHLADRPRAEEVKRGSPVPSKGDPETADSVADASWSMRASADRQRPVNLVVLDNGGFEFVRIEIAEAGVQAYGISFINPDWAKVAESVALTGIWVSEPRTVWDAVAEFLAKPGPAPPDAVVDLSALRPPPHVTFGEAEGFSLSLAQEAVSANLDDAIETMKGMCAV